MLHFAYTSLSLSFTCSSRVYFTALSFDAVRVREWVANTHLQNTAKNVHMIVYISVYMCAYKCVRIHLCPMYVCFLTYEAGTILTSKVVKPHTCVQVHMV